MKKKGQIAMIDYLFYIVMLLVFSITIIIAYITLSKTNTEFQASAEIPTESKTLVSNWTTRFKFTFDWFLATLVIGIGIAMIISAVLLRDNPMLVGISIIMWIIIGSLSYRFANVFYQFSSDSTIQPYSSQFSLIPIIMNNSPYIIILLLVVFIIVLLGKSRSDSFI